MNDLLHSFPGQESDEPVFVFARPYPLAFIPTAAVFLVIFLFSLLGEYVISNQLLLNIGSYLANIGILILGIFQLIIIIVFFVAVFDFYFDLIIVTDRRLVEIDQEQLFFRRISELGLEDVEDVASQQQGVFQSIFNYGQVEVQTAGTKDNFVMENIHLPREVTALVLDLKQQTEAKLEANQRFPSSEVIGVINNQPITTVGQLEQAGAITPDETDRANLKTQ